MIWPVTIGPFESFSIFIKNPLSLVPYLSPLVQWRTLEYISPGGGASIFWQGHRTTGCSTHVPVNQSELLQLAVPMLPFFGGFQSSPCGPMKGECPLVGVMFQG